MDIKKFLSQFANSSRPQSEKQSMHLLRELKMLISQQRESSASGSVTSDCTEDETKRDVLHPHLRYKDDPENERLITGTAVYIRRHTRSMLSKSNLSSTAIARNLLEEVFTDEALRLCSVRGQKCNGSYRAERRDSLHSDGIAAILSFIHNVNAEKGGGPLKNADLVAAMGRRLNELRRLLTPAVMLEVNVGREEENV